jgi:hypothetical protein
MQDGSARAADARLCGYREMPEQPCRAPVAWVIASPDGSSRQFACDRHRDAVLAKVTTAHRVVPVGDWLPAQRPSGGTQAG